MLTRTRVVFPYFVGLRVHSEEHVSIAAGVGAADDLA